LQLPSFASVLALILMPMAFCQYLLQRLEHQQTALYLTPAQLKYPPTAWLSSQLMVAVLLARLMLLSQSLGTSKEYPMKKHKTGVTHGSEGKKGGAGTGLEGGVSMTESFKAGMGNEVHDATQRPKKKSHGSIAV
jgi:hypothetical protein